MEVIPEGAIFLMNNKDRPGMIGWVGSVFGKHDINIAGMSLSRENQAGGQALTVFNLDSVPSPEALKEIESDPDISNVRVVQL
jgi:D-3-phosphoglycerate dehydrogenase